MSLEAAAWAVTSTGHGHRDQKFLLLVMADYAEPERHMCWPTANKLGETCMMDRTEVESCLNALEENGLITCLRKGAWDQPSLYRLNLGNALGGSPASPAQGVGR